MDTKLRQDDADEWFFESFLRYKHLFMYELEAPLDTIELLDPTNLCTTGIQAFSKKCEILQLGVPPKLLPKDIEDGLCKDRDFKIICGGYSSSRILQIQPIESEQVIAAVQADQPGVALFRLGDDQHGVIREEETRLNFPKDVQPSTEDGPKTGVIAARGKQVTFCSEAGDFICQWDLQAKENVKSKQFSQVDGVTKAIYWDDNVLSFCSKKGVVFFYDVRENDLKPSWRAKCAEPGLVNCQVVYSFDVKPEMNVLGICDTLGHIVFIDSRKPDQVLSQLTVPGYTNVSVLSRKFNLSFQKLQGIYSNEDDLKFIMTGFKEEIVPVYKFLKSGDIHPIFTHDGHKKTITNAIWHTVTDNLVFSASTDALLHAWQYIENQD